MSRHRHENSLWSEFGVPCWLARTRRRRQRQRHDPLRHVRLREPVREQFNPGLLIDPAEQILGEQIEAIARLVEPRFAAREYTSALKSLAVLRKAVDDFFDSVMVMADDATLRANRLALLRRLLGLFMHVADLSRLPG